MGNIFTVAIPIQFRDIDALGHVNNAVYLSYLEVVRYAFWRQVLGMTPADDIDFVLARVEIDYRRPVTINDDLSCSMWIEGIGRSSFTISYKFLCAGEEVVAQARSVQVFIDLPSKRPKPVPERFREQVRGYLVPGD